MLQCAEHERDAVGFFHVASALAVFNRRIDGSNVLLGESSAGSDILGAVKYVYSAGAQSGLVCVYLAHK